MSRPRTLYIPLASDALRDPKEWNSDWEDMLRRHFGLPHGPALCFNTTLHKLETRGSLDKSLAGYPSLVSATCAMQRNLTWDALTHFTNDDFEAKWMDADSDVRGEHILGAMAAVCSVANNLNEARSYCAPELRLLRLRLDGKVFLDLLRSVMLDDASFIPSEPVYVSHPRWDAWAAKQRSLNDSEAKKFALAEILLLRTKLICHVLQFTIRSFFGEDPPVLYLEKEKTSHKDPAMRSQERAEMVEILGRQAGRARARDDKAGTIERMDARLTTCSYLNCKKTQAPDSATKFHKCARCSQRMNREVFYCSKVCQTADWKLRHKAVCGKPLDFETASQAVEHPLSAPTSKSRIGPPVDGYKRSLALVSQVTEFNFEPTVDYYLYNAEDDGTAIDLTAGSYLQAVFRGHREMAMTTGDLFCIGAMAHYLCAVFLAMSPENRRGITSETIVAQFTREFGLDVRPFVLAAQEVQTKDPLHRPPLLSDTPPDVWATIPEALNVSNIVVTLDV
ncbi:hypothetical protein C8R46DRAFT_1092672 [Mycena filopes]|nr:hypothetical protein C8R46DRAFT_1092672 [Mycena filopes]